MITKTEEGFTIEFSPSQTCAVDTARVLAGVFTTTHAGFVQFGFRTIEKCVPIGEFFRPTGVAECILSLNNEEDFIGFRDSLLLQKKKLETEPTSTLMVANLKCIFHNPLSIDVLLRAWEKCDDVGPFIELAA